MLAAMTMIDDSSRLTHACCGEHAANDVAAALAHAEALCARRDRRLTPMRRRVLAALVGSPVPIGAYDIIDRLAVDGDRPAPISVYRALEFLVGEGLVHRLESRNAFLACNHRHADGEPVMFLICERCGATGEADAPDMMLAVTRAAASQGFTPHAPVIEITGLCARCNHP